MKPSFEITCLQLVLIPEVRSVLIALAEHEALSLDDLVQITSLRRLQIRVAIARIKRAGLVRTELSLQSTRYTLDKDFIRSWMAGDYPPTLESEPIPI